MSLGGGGGVGTNYKEGGGTNPSCPIQTQHTSQKGECGPHVCPKGLPFLRLTSVLTPSLTET